MPWRLTALIALSLMVACPGPNASWEEAFDASEVGWLLSVWGDSPNDLYAVGGSPSPTSRGVVWHRESAGWNAVELPFEIPLLNWVFGFGEELFMVGDQGVIVHFIDGAFELQTSPTDQDLWGTWGSSPTDIWAVGGDPFPGGTATVIHYDGTEWTEVTTPELSRANVFAFFKVWGSGPDDVWVVGQRGSVIHWDGAAWTEELIGASDDLVSLWGTGPDRIAVVGGRGNGVFFTYDGSSWQSGSIPGLPGLNGVWMRDDTIHTVGEQGTITTIDFDTRQEIEDASIATSIAFHAIFGDGKRLTTVGGNFFTPMGPFEGIAYARNLKSSD